MAEDSRKGGGAKPGRLMVTKLSIFQGSSECNLGRCSMAMHLRVAGCAALSMSLSEVWSRAGLLLRFNPSPSMLLSSISSAMSRASDIVSGDTRLKATALYGLAAALAGDFLVRRCLAGLHTPVQSPGAVCALALFAPPGCKLRLSIPAMLTAHVPVFLSAARSGTTAAAWAFAGGAAAAILGLARLLNRLKDVRASLLINPEDVIAGRTWLHLRWRGSMPERVARVHVACAAVGSTAVDVTSSKAKPCMRLEISGLRPGTLYELKLWGEDSAGVCGAVSETVTVSTLPGRLSFMPLRVALAAACCHAASMSTREGAIRAMEASMIKSGCGGRSLRGLLQETMVAQDSVAQAGATAANIAPLAKVGGGLLHSVHEDAAAREARIAKRWEALYIGVSACVSDVRIVFWGAEGEKSADIVVAANHHIAVVVILPQSPAVDSWASASGCFGGPTTACAVSLGDSAHGGTGQVRLEAWAGAARGDRMLTSKAWMDSIMGKEVLVTGHGMGGASAQLWMIKNLQRVDWAPTASTAHCVAFAPPPTVDARMADAVNRDHAALFETFYASGDPMADAFLGRPLLRHVATRAPRGLACLFSISFMALHVPITAALWILGATYVPSVNLGGNGRIGTFYELLPLGAGVVTWQGAGFWTAIRHPYSYLFGGPDVLWQEHALKRYVEYATGML